MFEAGMLMAWHSVLPTVRWEMPDGEEAKQGVLQQLYSASDGNISKTQQERLVVWRHMCAALFVAVLAYFVLFGAACIELFVRHRNDPDSLSIFGANLHAQNGHNPQRRQ